mmetsp:Transcript_39174/g.108953  ORF Transcript_39174/g.108953 Transcript_39174/m.108953 type:complete len:356 (+) Transcript_39174:90-1157(+)
MRRELVHCAALLLVQALQLPRHLLRLRSADVLGHGLQGREVGHGTLRSLPDLELGHLLLDEALRLQHLLLALLSIGLHHLLQVVHRVGGHALDLHTVCRDVPRDGDVHEHEFPLQVGQVGSGDDGLLARCGGKDHVTLTHDLHHAAQGRHLGVGPPAGSDLIQQRLRLVCGPVHQSQLHVGVLAEKSDEQKPGHLACADDADLHRACVLAQVRQGSRHHQLHGRAGDRDGTLADLCARACQLAHADARLQHLGDDLASRAGHVALHLSVLLFDAVLVASLDLRQDLGLTQDQRVKARANLEEMLRRGLPRVAEQVWVQLLAGEPRLLPQVRVHALHGSVPVDLRRSKVQLEAITC